jgi:AraC-like DNA-binding protein
MLAPYIKQYWYLELDTADTVPQLQRVVPNGFVEMVFHFSDRLLKIEKTRELQASIMICGQKTGFFDVLPTGRTEMLSIQFYPHAAGLFFNFPMSELADLTLHLEDAIGRVAGELEEQLHCLRSLEERVAHIECFLLHRLVRHSLYGWNRMQQNVSLINASNGLIKASALADAACLSRKQHEREFKKTVGLSPKQYLKVIRFQYSLFLQQHGLARNITDLALQSGYYDQAHMINDYRDLSGITPKQYFSGCDAVSDYF